MGPTLWIPCVLLLLQAPPAAPPTPPAPRTAPAPRTSPAPGTAPAPAPKAPDAVSIADVALKDLDGADVPLSKFAGTPMVIEVWATWCGPCKRQRELMLKLAPEFKEKVVFIAASVDTDAAATVRKYLAGKPACEELHECIATPPLLAAIRKKTTANSIPKVVYVSSKGEIVDVSATVQTESWMRAMLRNLR